MRRVAIALLAMTCFAVLSVNRASAQHQLPSVGFRNDTKTPIIIQGYAVVNGVQRRGAPLVVAPGRVAFDANVPPGLRFYSIYDANQPARVLLRDSRIVVAGDSLFHVQHSFQHPLLVDLAPAQVP